MSSPVRRLTQEHFRGNTFVSLSNLYIHPKRKLWSCTPLNVNIFFFPALSQLKAGDWKIPPRFPRPSYEECALEKEGKKKRTRAAVSTHMLQWSRSAVDSSRQGCYSQVWMFVKAAMYREQNWTSANTMAVRHDPAGNTYYDLSEYCLRWFVIWRILQIISRRVEPLQHEACRGV